MTGPIGDSKFNKVDLPKVAPGTAQPPKAPLNTGEQEVRTDGYAGTVDGPTGVKGLNIKPANAVGELTDVEIAEIAKSAPPPPLTGIAKAALDLFPIGEKTAKLIGDRSTGELPQAKAAAELGLSPKNAARVARESAGNMGLA